MLHLCLTISPISKWLITGVTFMRSVGASNKPITHLKLEKKFTHTVDFSSSDSCHIFFAMKNK